jgi:hypothetical protein
MRKEGRAAFMFQVVLNENIIPQIDQNYIRSIMSTITMKERDKKSLHFDKKVREGNGMNKQRFPLLLQAGELIRVEFCRHSSDLQVHHEWRISGIQQVNGQRRLIDSLPHNLNGCKKFHRRNKSLLKLSLVEKFNLLNILITALNSPSNMELFTHSPLKFTSHFFYLSCFLLSVQNFSDHLQQALLVTEILHY